MIEEQKSNLCIRTDRLLKRYDGNLIIKNVSLSIGRGDFTVIMGNSGSGKSTLLYLLSGLDAITAGEIWINDIPFHNSSPKVLSLLRRRLIGFVFQDHNLIPNLTLRENILVAGYLLKRERKVVVEEANHLMEQLDILSLADRYPARVSGGQLQRAAIARAMINHPSILLADEPTGNLNAEAAGRVLDCFSELNSKGQTIVMVTHDLKSACRGSRVLFLRDGEIEGDTLDTTIPNETRSEDSLFAWLKQLGW
jgi:putative ABC transport system ATP-binding protein